MIDMTYEQALKQLEETVEKMENGDLSLEESLKLYEKGNQLSAFCIKEIENAKLKIKEISEIENSQE